MKKIILFFLLFSFTNPVLSQEGFEFVNAKSNRVKVSAQVINNLVFIPVKVNGVELLFLLDTGVEETILFGFEGSEKIKLNRVEKVKIRGLGGKDGAEGLQSSGNVLTIGGIESKNHLLYLITDTSFDLSSFVGITVNGIIGYAAFKNHLVEIDYRNKAVLFYKPNSSFQKKIEKEYTKVALSIEGEKPYLNALVKTDNVEVLAKLLIDTGNSDAVWLFDRFSDKINAPKKCFDDYLGQGLSGPVEGKRGRIAEFTIADYKFDSPIVAFPDSLSIKNIRVNNNRLGSLGGEILKRFSVVFDYDKKQLFLKKNKSYNAAFYYNKSGIEVWHSGVQWVKRMVKASDNSNEIGVGGQNAEKKSESYSYKMDLKPLYEIGYIRQNSNAALRGLKIGDIIVAIDGKEVFNYSLQEVNSQLWSEDEIWVELKIIREGEIMNFKFQLLNVL